MARTEETEKRKTTYVVLRGLRYESRVEVEANSPEQAIRIVADGDPGTYTVVPKRSLHTARGTYEEVPPPFTLVPVDLPAGDGQLAIGEHVVPPAAPPVDPPLTVVKGETA